MVLTLSAMPTGVRSFAASRGKVVRQNVSASGSRLLVHLNMAMLTSAILAFISGMAHDVVEDPHPIQTWRVDGVNGRVDGYYELSDIVPSSFNAEKPIFRKATWPPAFLYFVAEPQVWQISSNHADTTCVVWGLGDDVDNVTAWKSWAGSGWQVDDGITATPAEESCDSSAVQFGTWFQVMYVLQGLSCLLFVLMQCGLASLLDDIVPRERTSPALEPPAIPASEPSSTPAGGAEPAVPQQVSMPDPVPESGAAPTPPCPDHVPTLWDACMLSNLMCSTALIFVITGFLLFWSLLGVFLALDAGNPDNEACRSGLAWIWILALVNLAQTWCCHIFTTADAHVSRAQAPTLDV